MEKYEPRFDTGDALGIRDAVTIACKKGLSRTVLRAFIGKTISELGLYPINVYYFCDDPAGGKGSEKPISWHIAFDKLFEKNQVLQFGLKIEEFRRRNRLGDVAIFSRWGVYDAERYLLKHAYFDKQKIIS